MRTHEQIIADAGGYKQLGPRLADHIGVPVKRGEERVRFWERRKSVPLAWWPALEELRVASTDELLCAAQTRARPTEQHGAQA